jgi:hypothetical protein
LLWTFDTFCGHLVCFFKFWYVLPRQIWQPWRRLHQNRRLKFPWPPKPNLRVWFGLITCLDTLPLNYQ